MNKEDGLVFSFILKGGSGQRLDWEQVKRWNPAQGILWLHLEGGSGQRLDWEQVKRWTPAQGILWLHLDFKNERVKKWLFEESGIDAVSCEALLAEETRPRVVASSHSLLLILRGVNCNPGADPEDMVCNRGHQ
jgi:Mg2+ and Co2+ transporter CorA